MSAVRRLRAATLALAAVAVISLALAGVLVVRDGGTAPPADLDVAVVDRDATRGVIDAVESGLNEILAYDYRHPRRAEGAAAAFLTGEASDQYRRIYDALAAAGERQRLVHHSTVSRIGVQRLTGSSADLLVFLEQETIRTRDGATNRAPAQVHVEAVRVDGTWKVSAIELL